MFSCFPTPAADMPEKRRVSIAPDAKGDGKKTEKPKRRGSQEKKETKRDGVKSRNSDPIQRKKENIKRSYDVRKVRGKHDDKIKSVVEEQESDRQYLLEQIANFRRDNERLLRQQTHKFGLTLDEMKHVKEDLEIARSANDVLYHEVEARKEECDKLQAELESLVDRLNVLTLEKYDLLHEKRTYRTETLQVQKAEQKVSALIRDNKVLRLQLLHNKIDPNADASKITSTTNTVSTSSPKTDIGHREKGRSRFPNVNNRKTAASSNTESVYYEPSEPVVYTRKSLMKFRSMEDLRPEKESTTQNKLKRSRSYNSQTVRNGRNRNKQSDSLTRSNKSGRGIWA